MKKLLALTTIVLMVTGTAYAVPKSNCGCGLGSMVMEGQDALVFQVLAATTNGTFGNQTFGISTGTLGCDRPANIVQNKQVNEFVAGNMDNLAVDIASGQGESLDTLSEMIEVPAEKRPVFYSALQKNFDMIYPNTDVTHDHVIQQIAVIVEHI